MKKIAFFVLLLFTAYLAGSYRSPALTALAVAEAVLGIALFFLARWFRRGLSPRFSVDSASTTAGEGVTLSVVLQNRRRFPVSRVRLRLRVAYEGKRPRKKHLLTAADPGETQVPALFSPAWCGLVRIRLDRTQVYDPLSLFSCRKKERGEMVLAVFPPEKAMQIIPNPVAGEDGGTGDVTVNRPGDAYHEIRQIRDYRTGDPLRHIHWNLSAKTDQLRIREYERETDLQVDVLADPTGAGGPEKLDAFYRLLSALVLGLLQNATAVRVIWLAPSPDSVLVTGAEDCRDMLSALYRAAPHITVWTKEPELPRGILRLSGDLSLWDGTALIHRFSPDTMAEDLEKKTFIL